MPKYIVYIDDSGTKEYAGPGEAYGATGKTRYFVFGAALMTTVASGKLVEALQQLKRQYFGTDQVEIKSTWLRRPEHQQKKYLEPYGLTEDDLKRFVQGFYDAIVNTDLQLIAAVIDKQRVQERYASPWYAPAIAYDLLMQRVVQECAEPNCVTVTIDDMTGATPKGNQYKDNLKRHHTALKQRGSALQKGIDFSPLSGDIKFVSSARSHQVQVADVVAYNIYRQFVDYGEQWEDRTVKTLPTYEWFARLGRKFRQGPNQRVQGYGVAKFPLIRRVAWGIRQEE